MDIEDIHVKVERLSRRDYETIQVPGPEDEWTRRVGLPAGTALGLRLENARISIRAGDPLQSRTKSPAQDISRVPSREIDLVPGYEVESQRMKIEGQPFYIKIVYTYLLYH